VKDPLAFSGSPSYFAPSLVDEGPRVAASVDPWIGETAADDDDAALTLAPACADYKTLSIDCVYSIPLSATRHAAKPRVHSIGPLMVLTFPLEQITALLSFVFFSLHSGNTLCRAGTTRRANGGER
jgi:hypothetical protein